MSRSSLFVGTYTDGSSHGIYRCELDSQSGELTTPSMVAETENPSFLAMHPSTEYLYAVNETPEGAVTAFAISDGGDIEVRARRRIGSGHPCYASIARNGEYLFVAHYTGGAVSMIPIDASGSLGHPTIVEHSGSSVDPERQCQPHPHAAVHDPRNDSLYVPDLGTDRIMRYDIDRESGTLNPGSVTPTKDGAGPRHLAFGPNREYLYVTNELASSISVYRVDETDGITAHITSIRTVPDEYEGENFPGEVLAVGDVVYASNRGHDSICLFSRDGSDHRLIDTVDTGGMWPRHFTIDSESQHLIVANERTGTIRSYAIDTRTGSLAFTGSEISVPRPVHVLVDGD